jgi:hypothetical protein
VDPNQNLREQRRLVAEIQRVSVCCVGDMDSSLGEELAELVKALDEWISKGGFLPSAWGGCDGVHQEPHRS